MSILNRLLAAGLNLTARKDAKKQAPELTDGTFTYAPPTENRTFFAGFGTMPVLPDDIDKKKYYIAGYSDHNPARGVIDPQYVSALWLDDGSGGWLFISADVVGLLSKDVNRLKDGLSDFCRLTGCRGITVMATHNHAGIDTMGIWGPLPLTGRDEKFMSLLFRQAKAAAMAAYEDRREGKLYYGTAEVPDMQEDIRTPEVYSKTLTRFRFVPDDGAPETWFLNFASHSESLQGCNHLVSADFPAYLREQIRIRTGARTFYTVGAIGGMISMDIGDEDLLRREHRLLESTRGIGRKLGDYACGIENDRPLSARISAVVQPFYVKVENPLLSMAAVAGIMQADRYFLPEPAVLTQMTYMELDDVPMLFLPGELFPELVFGGALAAEDSATGKGPECNPPPLSETAGAEELLVFGLADDELGYILPPNDFYLNPDKPYLDKGIDCHGRRHYEETNSTGPETARTVSDTFIAVMDLVKKTKSDYQGGK